MNYDHNAIRRAYPNKVLTIQDDDGIYDGDNKLFEPDQDLVNAARVALDKEEYKGLREIEYPNVGIQLDYIYHNGLCLLYTSPSPRDRTRSRMPSSA